MADFFTNLTGNAQLDNSILQAYAQGFMVANGQAQILEPLVTIKRDISAVSIRFTKYGRLALATTPLSEREDVVLQSMADSEILLTPTTYGTAVATTELSSLTSGGTVDLAKATLVGLNAGSTQDALIVSALEASANKEFNVTMSGAQLDGQYTKLASSSVQMINGLYVAVMPEALIAILRAESGWIDVAKYANAEDVLKNEVGMYKGHRIVRHQGISTGVCVSLGANALGKAVSQDLTFVAAPPTDALQRFFRLGWKGVFKYQIVDTDAVQILTAAAS
ncbi:hypothetical protein [Aquabacterium sp.]|uniref:hypothetical protein n=1 Tax=Aquabacterium sp. TaxID=1872578 RepID=UPI003D6D1E30